MEHLSELPCSYEQLPESELLDLSFSGHQGAFREIVGRHYHRLYATALTMLDSHSAAEQALQNAIKHAYSNMQKYDLTESLFFTWLCKQVIDYIFRNYPMPGLEKSATPEKSSVLY